MKLLLFLLLPFAATAQQSTRWQGDSNFRVQLVSDDTTKIRVYNGGDIHDPLNYMRGSGKYITLWSDGTPVYFPTGETNLAGYIKNKQPDTVYVKKVDMRSFVPPTEDNDTLYYDGTLFSNGQFYSKPQPATAKYDTIGPVWRLCSDTTKGWNPVSAMKVFEVREYVNKIVSFGGPLHDYLVPDHYMWLDSNKKLLKLKVW